MTPRHGGPAKAAEAGPTRLRLGYELGRLRRVARRCFGVQVLLFPRGGRVSIVKLAVPKALRGKGRARAVMNQICAWADDREHTLGVGPTGEWGADLARLTAFYRSFGFVENVDLGDPYVSVDRMVRPPVVPAQDS